MPFARWAHMRHFLSVHLYGLDRKSDWIIIHISESITGRTLKLHHIWAKPRERIKPWSLNHLHGLLQFVIDQDNAYHMCESQGGLIANVKLHF